jgi:hypothetical protein
MNEQCRIEAWKDDIRASRKRPVVKPVSQSLSVQRASQQHFGARVLLTDARHDFGPGLCIDGVHSDHRYDMGGYERIQMAVKIARRRSSSDENADFHVLLHRVAGQIRATKQNRSSATATFAWTLPPAKLPSFSDHE